MHFSPSIDKIPSIHNASNFGCIEIGRGCNRNCKFCEITKSNLRWYPSVKIEEELKINNQNGLKKGLIHAEDVLLYGQNGFIPNDKKLIKLFNLVYKYYDKFIITHFSLAASSHGFGSSVGCDNRKTQLTFSKIFFSGFPFLSSVSSVTPACRQAGLRLRLCFPWAFFYNSGHGRDA